ncbi:MAG: ComF family protein [Terracidiphilus sp.]
MDALGCALLPAFCALCGSPLPRLSSVPICDACWTEFPVQSGPMCARCGDTLAAPALASGSPVGRSSAALCKACRLAPPPFVRAVAYGLYQDRMKDAIHALKYDRLYPTARGLGRMLAEAIAQLAAEAPVEMLVVPVPLHRSKYIQRGFNQARSLAAHAIAALRKTHPEWRFTLAPAALMRLRATQSQAGLTPRQRRINVRGAFSVSDRAAVAGKHILVVDDILTTGATARAAAQALVQAGAASVWVATLARARRTNEFSRSSYNRFNEVEDNQVLAGPPLQELAARRGEQEAFTYSLHDQPSF